MRRREFFHPRHLAEATGHVVAAANELHGSTPSPVADPTDIALLRFSRRAMATTFEVVLPLGTPQPYQAAGAALDLVDALEAQLSVYRDASEVCRINRQAASEPVSVESRLFELLRLSAELSRSTEGAFDIAAGALVRTWGFLRGPRRVPTKTERLAALRCVGMHHVELASETHSVRFRRPGIEINLGSIGKGYALDRAAETLVHQHGIRSALLHGGHSSVLAIGTAPNDTRGWPVGISHPEHTDQRLGVLHLKDQALGTSSAAFRHLEWQGRKLGHVLDPRTGWPAEGIASASVVAPTAAEADALATAFFILGVEKAAAYCAAHPGIGAILLPAGAKAPVVLGAKLESG